MPISIDEVVADVRTPEGSAPAAPPAESQPPAPSALRQIREQCERMQQRGARVKAD